jgi:hypothetical protein
LGIDASLELKSSRGIGITQQGGFVTSVTLHVGILPPTLFTTLVLMAIVTTLLTAPLFSLVLNGQRVDDIMPASTAKSASTAS